jgi:hypothetical protein
MAWLCLHYIRCVLLIQSISMPIAGVFELPVELFVLILKEVQFFDSIKICLS